MATALLTPDVVFTPSAALRQAYPLGQLGSLHLPTSTPQVLLLITQESRSAEISYDVQAA